MTSAHRAIDTRQDGWLKTVIRVRASRLEPRLRRRAALAHRSPETSRLRDLLASAHASDARDGLPPRPADPNRFVVTTEHAAFLSRLVQDGGARRVLEFGAGWSTWVMARALADGAGGSVTTVENAPGWCEDMLARATTVPGVDVRQVAGELRSRWTPAGVVRTLPRLDADLRGRGPFDLVFVDGPFWREGREGTLYAALPHLRPGARIVLDDAGRPYERWVLSRWLAACPALRLELHDESSAGKGLAVLRLDGPGELRGTPGAIVDSLLLAGLLVAARRSYRRTRRRARSPRPVEAGSMGRGHACAS